jgi:hypothetical protein
MPDLTRLHPVYPTAYVCIGQVPAAPEPKEKELTDDDDVSDPQNVNEDDNDKHEAKSNEAENKL